MNPRPTLEELETAFAQHAPVLVRFHPADTWGNAAVLAPLLPTGNGWALVFTLRPRTLSTHQGQMSFPGGRADPEDRSLIATALRECHEELGVPPHAVRLLGRLGKVPSGSARVNVHAFVGALPPTITFQPNPAEVAEVVVIPIADLLDPECHHTETRQFMGRSVPVHFYEWRGYTIWGLTGFMLHELLKRWPNSR
nr:CoA pyrophosphatase [Ardenticatena sp.]